MQNDAFIRNSEIGQSTDYANSILGFAIGKWKLEVQIQIYFLNIKKQYKQKKH